MKIFFSSIINTATILLKWILEKTKIKNRKKPQLYQTKLVISNNKVSNE